MRHILLNPRGPAFEGARELLVLQTQEHFLKARPLPDGFRDLGAPLSEGLREAAVHNFAETLSNFLSVLELAHNVLVPRLKRPEHVTIP